MTYTVARLAELVGGTLHGDGSIVIRSALPIPEATPDSITFLAELRHSPRLQQSRAGAALVPQASPPFAIPTIAVADPLRAILKIAACFQPPLPQPAAGIDPRAAVDPTVQVGRDVSIGAFAVVEAGTVIGDGATIHPQAVVRAGCTIGMQAAIHPHAVLYPGTIVGDRTVVHSGAVIGGDGFGYQQRGGCHEKIPQLGIVELGADVEIGANATVDRAMLGRTRIGAGTKIDNLVMVGHNCQVGKHNIFVSQTGVAGSCTTGDYVVLAGKVGVADHVNIGERAVIGAGSGVYTDIPAGETYLGYPARPERIAKRLHLAFEHLPEMRRHLSRILGHLGLGDEENIPAVPKRVAG